MDRLAMRLAARDALREVDAYEYIGRLTRQHAGGLEGVLPAARQGALCRVGAHGREILAEIVGMDSQIVHLMPLESTRGLTQGARVVLDPSSASLRVGPGCLGRVLDGLGRPIDGLGPIEDAVEWATPERPPNPLTRRAIDRPLDLGVRAVNALLTVGEGQRLSISAGAGVGKSTLLGMMARHTQADVAVIALIGERGREVQEFVAREIGLGQRGADHVVVVASTSDEPAAMRLRAAFTATSVAEWFRDQGLRVLLLMDSLSRVAQAQREIGLASGELPAQRGYPPSAFALIPALLERAGQGSRGSITALYTTLMDADEGELDPISDAVRGTTDGHIVLSRALAERGIFPAIDAPRSLSRVMPQLVPASHLESARALRELWRVWQEAQDMVTLGAWKHGANPAHDAALEVAPALWSFLSQPPEARVSVREAVHALDALIEQWRQRSGVRPALGASLRPTAAAPRAYASQQPASPQPTPGASSPPR